MWYLDLKVPVLKTKSTCRSAESVDSPAVTESPARVMARNASTTVPAGGNVL